jgi:hypothetical protein
MRRLLVSALILTLAGCGGADSALGGDIREPGSPARVPAPAWLVSQGPPFGFQRVCAAFFCGSYVPIND